MLIRKSTKLAIGFFAAILLSLGGILPVQADPFVVGTGPDSSYLIIQSSMFSATLTTLIYQYNYTYDPTKLEDGYTLLRAIEEADTRLKLFFSDPTDPPNYFLSAIEYDSVKLTGVAVEPYYPYWAQWVSGGEGGYLTQGPYADNVWTYGSGVSAPFRTLSPGSWDGYTYNAVPQAQPPSISPIPEPGSMLLGGFGCLLLLLSSLRRWVTKRQRGL
ncbi:MAG: hypothetical protein ABIP97_11100 [Chthoniobacterales bacterium]